MQEAKSVDLCKLLQILVMGL